MDILCRGTAHFACSYSLVERLFGDCSMPRCVTRTELVLRDDFEGSSRQAGSLSHGIAATLGGSLADAIQVGREPLGGRQTHGLRFEQPDQLGQA